MSIFLGIFLTLLAVNTIVRLGLALRQMSHIAKYRATVPTEFADLIPLDAHQKAADYNTAKQRVGLFAIVYDVAILLLMTLGGGFAFIDQQLAGLGLGAVWTGVAVLVGAILVMSVLDAPFSIYRTFGVEQRFGFNRTKPGLFIADAIRGLLLLLAFGVPLAALMLWLMTSAGEFWWLYAWAVWTGFSLLMVWAFPRFIAPMFNEFRPLIDKDLKDRIDNLLSRCGFSSNGVYVIDGSRRSSHGNAYFSGVGNNKRIVFYDTLIDGLTPAQIEAVLAHELGHFRRQHIRKRLWGGMVTSAIGFALLGWLSKQAWFYTDLGVSSSTHMALLLFMMVTPVFTFLLQPLNSRVSRKHEFEADEYAVEKTNGDDLITALVCLYKDNASTLTPDPMHSAFYDSHPPAPIRIEHIKQAMTSTTNEGDNERTPNATLQVL